MKNFLTLISQWLRFRLYYYIKFLRPASFKIEGKIYFDMYSMIIWNAGSEVSIGSGCKMKRSIIRCTDSRLKIAGNACLKQARLLLNESSVEIGDGFTMKEVMMSGHKNSTFSAGKHFQLGSNKYYKAGFFFSASNISLGDNVNVYAHIDCVGGSLATGNSVFLNSGTQIRCANEISFGSNIFVSYECIIFDSNTHSVSASDRIQEIIDGYPNNAIQTESTKLKIKTAPIHIGDGCWIGTRAIIFKGSVLGDNVIVGAAAVLSGLEVKESSTVYGNPAKIKQ